MSIKLTATAEELREQFRSLSTPEDVASLLEIEYKHLIYYIYVTQKTKGYTKFSIPKKHDGVREINAPNSGLKIIQQKLNQVLQAVYEPKAPVHGFTNDRSIVTNAKRHLRRKFVLSIDLENFFPSINFGRVRGMFISAPYNLPPAVATILAQISCFNNELPQGSPTSPIISNMICSRMDSQLRRLAEKYRCDYTRYADDLTFSTSVASFPRALATVKSEITKQLEVGNELKFIIEDNGFKINANKVKLRNAYQRQEVTGITTNEFLNVSRSFVRQISAMLHAWEKYGLEAAQAHFDERFDKKHRGPFKGKVSFKKVVQGKIEFLGTVRGTDDFIYIKFRDQLGKLAPELVRKNTTIDQGGAIAIEIITEGKTDWKHLKAAFLRLQEQGYYRRLSVQFLEYEDEIQMGGNELLNYCKYWSKTPHNNIKVCVFDCDDQDVTKKATIKDKTYKAWGNNVFSFAIPVPDHRVETPQVCIELYYKDDEIKRKDVQERRLFLSNEFHQNSGRHLEENLNYTEVKRINRPILCIVDDKVFDENSRNVAMPKNDFANYILNNAENFNDFDISEFKKIFDLIQSIANDNFKR